MDDEKIGKIKVFSPRRLFRLGGRFFWIAFSVIFLLLVTPTDIITDVANIALALSVVVALVFGIAQVKAAARDRKERMTMEALRNFQSREFVELIQFISMHPAPSTFEEMRKLPNNEQIMFIQFTQAMESIGMLVAERYINIDLVDKTLGSFVITSWEKIKILITDIREKQADPYMNEYFQWLAEDLSKQMKNKPRKPFYELGIRQP